MPALKAAQDNLATTEKLLVIFRSALRFYADPKHHFEPNQDYGRQARLALDIEQEFRRADQKAGQK